MATNQPTEYVHAFDGNPDGGIIAKSDGKIGFYGITPIVQRPYTSSVHLSSEIASSTDFAAAQLAVLNECQKTFVALGIWATV